MAVERPTFRLIRESFGCHNLNSVDRKSKMLWFSECLETDLLNGTGGLGLGSREWAECATKITPRKLPAIYTIVGCFLCAVLPPCVVFFM